MERAILIKKLILLILMCPFFLHSYELKDYEGYWSFTNDWEGYMGAALQIKNGKFKYWFYSDVKLDDEPRYPIEGKVEIKGVVLHLIAKTGGCKPHWYLIKSNGTTWGMIALSNLAVIHRRNEKISNRMMALVPNV